MSKSLRTRDLRTAARLHIPFGIRFESASLALASRFAGKLRCGWILAGVAGLTADKLVWIERTDVEDMSEMRDYVNDRNGSSGERKRTKGQVNKANQKNFAI